MPNLNIRAKIHKASLPLRTVLAHKGRFLSKNDRKLWDLKDAHKGSDAVIIGMGPSLQPSDLKLFGNMVSFACNKIYLGLDNVAWRPDYYCVMDELVLKNNTDEIRNFSGPTKLFPKRFRRNLGNIKDTIYYPSYSHFRELDQNPYYHKNPIKGVVSGGATVIIPMIQFAYWTGCQRVYIVGLDFSFDLAKVTNELTSSGETVLVNASEQNHFHKDYRKPGETWTMPKMEPQREAFDYARRAYEADNRALFNASKATKLDVIEKVDFSEIFCPE